MATLSMSTRVGASCLLFIFVSIGTFAGCAEADTDGDEGGGGGTPGPTSSTTDASTSEMSSSSTGTPTSCTFDEGFDVGAECGVFVKAGAPDTNDCSRAMPCATIEEALTKVTSANPRVFLCTTAIEEAVVLPGGVSIYGGFACSQGWTWNTDGRTPWTAGPDEIPLTFDGGSLDSEVAGVELSSADATLPGGSSVVIFANGGGLTLSRAGLAAGSGVPGDPGEAGVDGTPGQNGELGTTDVDLIGGSGGLSDCNAGGIGAPVTCNPDCMVADLADPGEPGVPSGGGSAGASGPNSCTAGGEGTAGAAGANGIHAVGIGTIDDMGFHPPKPTDGEPGLPGGGGGGGGGKTAELLGGGGGGGGGCGATAGLAGMSGGSSIAIVAFGTALSFDGVSALVGLGGDGAAGGGAALGGTFGFGGQGGCKAALCGSPAVRGCSGGAGGVGGASGAGGSGAGGHALIVAYNGPAPSVLGLTYVTPTASQAGDAPDGASVGVAAAVLEFD
jgi:hypothetical protein